MEVSYHSSDDDSEEEMVFEELEVDDEESSNSSDSNKEVKGEEKRDDAGNASAPVKAKAPVPLHQLLHSKLKNTPVTLSDKRSGNIRSVKELAAAFNPPRPLSVTQRSPIKTSPKTVDQKSPTQLLTESPKQTASTKINPLTKGPIIKSPQQRSEKKPVAKRAVVKAGPSSGKARKGNISSKKQSQKKVPQPDDRGWKYPTRRFSTNPMKAKAQKIQQEKEAGMTMNQTMDTIKSESGSSSSTSVSLPTKQPHIDSKNNDRNKRQTKKMSNEDSPRKKTEPIKPKSNPVGNTPKNEIIIPNENPKKKSSMKKSSEDSASGSSYSFSVSSGTDESLAAKIGSLGTPFAPLPIAANFMPDNLNTDSPSFSNSRSSGNQNPDTAYTDSSKGLDSKGLKRQVSWSDLLGDGSKSERKPRISDGAEGNSKSDGNGDEDESDDDSDSFDSYETVSSDEFETDSEEDRSGSKGLQGTNLDELVEDEESAETSDYETDTTYERKYAAAEGRTPPPPKKRASDPELAVVMNSFPPFFSLPTNPNFNPMPVVEENEIKDNWSSPDAEGQRRRQQNPFFQGSQAPDAPAYGAGRERHSRRRKPFEDIPTAVAAELRKVSKNPPGLSDDDSNPLGITGWDGQGERGKRNLINQIFKKKGNGNVKENRTDSEGLPWLHVPPSPPPFDPPDYDDDEDEISNITDRVFAPKRSKPNQSMNAMREPVSQRSLDSSGRFSISSFRRSNSVRNTERALEGLKATSIEPKISLSRYRDLPEERKRSLAVLSMQNEAIDFYPPHEHDSPSQSSSYYRDMSPSSSRAFDSREYQNAETEGMDSELNNIEIVEEVFVGYDDENAINSPFETQFDDPTDRVFNSEHGEEEEKATTQKSNADKFDNIDEVAVKRNSRRLHVIICIVICNLLLLLGIGTWQVLEHFFWDESRARSNGPSPEAPALSPNTADKTVEDIKDELETILKPNLQDGGKGFDEEMSPQSEALDWLSKDPHVHTYTEKKISTRFALATFYYATNGDNWTSNHLWLTDVDECMWYTSSSDNPCTNGQYSRLVLTDNNLQGTISEELSLLSSSLVELDLVGTFSGQIPFNIGDFTELTLLRLSGRILSGTIPESLYMLSNLSILNLEKNLLSGGFSGSIGSMSSSLRSISLMDNHLTGSIPEEIGQLSKLTYFNIDDNYFEVLSESSIGRLTNLETLSARNNALKGSLPPSIGNSLTNLKGLFLNNNEFTGSIPPSYGNLFQLEAGLDLSSNKLTGRVPESLGQLSMLTNLLLRDNGLSGTIPLSWGKLSILNTLRLDSTNFEGALPSGLCDSFNEAYSSFYADCRKLDCPCCNFCCDGDTGECVCRFEDSLPILCVEP
jgi:hypothetical protein